ncbi:MAG: transglycosylase SLT domain-containing protein [Polyangiales bacterium]
MRAAMRYGLWVALLMSGCATAPAPRTTCPEPARERAAPEREAPSFEVLDGAAVDLARAFDRRLTVWTRPDGTRVHVEHCRQAPGGCRARIAAMSRILAEAADAHGLDPFLLGAIAMRESAINPEAIGAAGEAGVMQLHPRGLGHDVRFVQDASYRERCLQRADGCQGPVVRYAASRLAEATERCGDLETALGLYNGGRCTPKTRYVEHIRAERARLRAHASEGAGGGELATAP